MSFVESSPKKITNVITRTFGVLWFYRVIEIWIFNNQRSFFFFFFLKKYNASLCLTVFVSFRSKQTGIVLTFLWLANQTTETIANSVKKNPSDLWNLALKYLNSISCLLSWSLRITKWYILFTLVSKEEGEDIDAGVGENNSEWLLCHLVFTTNHGLCYPARWSN